MRREITLKTNKKQSGILARHTASLAFSSLQPAQQLTTDYWQLTTATKSPRSCNSWDNKKELQNQSYCGKEHTHLHRQRSD